MTSEEFARFRERSPLAFADDHHRSSGADVVAVREFASMNLDRVLARGVQTEGHFVQTILRNGAPVGWLWVGVRASFGVEHLFVYDIWLEDDARGLGVGRAAMGLVEEIARTQGLDEVQLNVFGANEVAGRLYDSLGYEIVALTMRKRLTGGSG